MPRRPDEGKTFARFSTANSSGDVFDGLLVNDAALAKGVEMPIVSQVAEVLAGTLNPRDIAPHLTTDDLPQGE